MRIGWIVVLGLLLIGSFAVIIMMGDTTRQERAAKFMATCGHADFSPTQCEFLFALREKTTDNTLDTTLAISH